MNNDIYSKRQLTFRSFNWVVLIPVPFFVLYFSWAVFHPIDAWMMLAFLLIFCAAAFFAEYLSCTLDRDQRLVTIRQMRIWRKSQRQIPFNDIHTISVQEVRANDADSSTSFTYYVLFVLKSGESFRLSSRNTGSKAKTKKMVQNMVDFINQGRPGVVAALDGIVRIKQEGATDGVNWLLEFITNNDRTPLTRWGSDYGQFMDGFLIIFTPARGMRVPGGALAHGGWAGMATDYFFNMYLSSLDLNTSQLPGFDKAVMLKGSEVGLDDRFAVLTNNQAAAQAWLTPGRKQLLANWMSTPPLQGKKDAVSPNIAATTKGMTVAFRGNFPVQDQLNQINHLGLALIRS